jgi:prepilin-type N-terminal cleavage/methylation domain-containing protein
VRRSKCHWFWQEELGFTLPEALITVVIMGIIFAIATSSWAGLVESRRVDSSTNQIVSDLRLAHIRATDRLTTWRLEVVNASNGTYQIGPSGGPYSSRSLGQGTKFTSVTTVDFTSDGGATITGPGITIAAADGAPSHAIQVNTVTSRVKVVS